MQAAGNWLGIERGEITWAVLLDGTVGALISAILAVAVGVYAVHRTIEHERRQALNRALLDRAASTLAEGQKVLPVKDIDEDAMWAAVLPLLAAAMALRMEMAASRPNFGRWLQAETESISALGSSAGDEEGRDELISTIARFLFAIALWGEAGLPDWSKDEVRSVLESTDGE